MSKTSGHHFGPVKTVGAVNPSTKRRLRVGILIDDFTIPLWAYKMLERISMGNYAEFAVVVKNDSIAEKPRFLEKCRRFQRNFSYGLYRRLDRSLYGISPNAFELIDLRNLVKSDVLLIQPIRTKFSDQIGDGDLEKIKSYEVDVLLRLGFRILRGGILKAAKYGVWSYHHGDNDVNRGGPPGLWEVFNGWDETGAILQVLTEDLDNGLVLAKTVSSTDKFSVNRNLNSYYWKALSIVPRKLEELYELGGPAFLEKAQTNNSDLRFYCNRLFKSPTNLEVLSAASRLAYSKFRQKLFGTLYLHQWILLFAFNKDKRISRSIYRFKKIVPPRDRFWADPHLVERDDKYYVFVEELLFKTNKGHISVLEINDKGVVCGPTIVLEKDYHLSYPFVFEDSGILYMVPESKSNKTIELYKCVEFPYKWELVKVLMKDVEAVDATILKKDGLYWLFANIRENKGASILDELFLFSSECLVSSEWKPHPRNPIVSDARRARPAGGILEIDGNLYRPAQNCSKHYGYGIQINNIVQLDRENYKEELAGSIYPGWDKDIVATHTLSFESNLTVIDAQLRRPRWW